jgi:hypothetical protein
MLRSLLLVLSLLIKAGEEYGETIDKRYVMIKNPGFYFKLEMLQYLLNYLLCVELSVDTPPPRQNNRSGSGQ